MRMTVEMTANPTQMVQSSFNLWQDYLTLWNNSAQRILGQGTAPTIEPAADERFNGATQYEGSWWPDWDGWLKKQSDKTRVPARAPSESGLQAVADAPGIYIMMKAVD